MIETVLELRQYTLRPGQREVLVELFDRELVESQEALGMRVLFVDVEDKLDRVALECLDSLGRNCDEGTERAAQERD